MDISEILDIRPISDYVDMEGLTMNQYGMLIEAFEPGITDLENFDIALIGLPIDVENEDNENCIEGPDRVRAELFKLYNWDPSFFCVDMGNIIPGDTVDDTYERIGRVCGALMAKKIVPILIGGTHDMTYGQFLGYSFLDQSINLAVFDEKIDLNQSKAECDSTSFLFKIIGHEPNYLSHYIQAGYQHYLNDPQIVNTLEGMQFDCWRLAHLNENPNRIEPLVRHADMVSIDLSVLRYTDAAAQKNNSPHGLRSETACSLTRFSGLSDVVSSIGIYEYYGQKDSDNQTAQVVAQMVWHFIEGYYGRKSDEPSQDNDYYLFTVKMEDAGHDLLFIKSKKSERWWMKIPVTKLRQKTRFEYVPCLYEDYKTALNNEIPDVWMNAYLRLS
jgi:formiminoglutamase